MKSLKALRLLSSSLLFACLFSITSAGQNASAEPVLSASRDQLACSEIFSATTQSIIPAIQTAADAALTEELFYLNALYPKKKYFFSRVVDHQKDSDFKITDGSAKFINPKFQVLYQKKRQLTFFRPTTEVIQFLARAFSSGEILRIFKTLDIQSIRISTLSVNGQPVNLDLLPVVSTELRNQAISKNILIQPAGVKFVLLNGKAAQFVSFETDTLFYDLLAHTRHHVESAFDELSRLTNLKSDELKIYINPFDSVEILRGLGFEYETSRLGLAGRWQTGSNNSLEFYYRKILSAIIKLRNIMAAGRNVADPKLQGMEAVFFSVAMRLSLFRNLQPQKLTDFEAQLGIEANRTAKINGKIVRKRLFDLIPLIENLGYKYVTPNGYVTIEEALKLKQTRGQN